MAASLLATSAFAKDGGANTHFGYNHLDVSGVTGNGVNFGFGYTIPLKVLGNGNDTGLEAGFSADIGYGITNVDSSNGGFENGDAQIFLGYQKSDFHIRGGVGYGFLKLGSEDNSMIGAEYTASTGYNFTKKYGFDIFYKDSTMSPAVGPDVDVSYVGVNFNIHR